MSPSPFHVVREQFHLAWDATIPPVLTVESVTEIEFDVLDASCGQIRPDSGLADLEALDFARVDQVVGPI